MTEVMGREEWRGGIDKVCNFAAEFRREYLGLRVKAQGSQTRSNQRKFNGSSTKTKSAGAMVALIITKIS